MTTLNFGSSQYSSLEVYSIALQKAKEDLSLYDATTKDYVDTKLLELKNSILGENVSAAYDTLVELENFLKNNDNVSAALLAQLNQLSSDLASEVSSRQSADTALSESVDAEASRATLAEQSLSADLLAETQQREAAQLALSQEVARVETERIASDNAILNQVNLNYSEMQNVDASKFDKSGGLISGAVSVQGSVAVNGNLNLDVSENTGSYLYFSNNWRLGGSSDGLRLVFEFFKDGSWQSAVPFIRS